MLIREDYESFCREGRLVGTAGNHDAAAFLKQALERAGFLCVEEPPPRISLLKLAIFFLILVGVMLGTSVVDPNFRPSRALIPVLSSFLTPLILLLRVWFALRSRAPSAIFGLPKIETGESRGGNVVSAPTLILCAHYDSASVPSLFAGSMLELFAKLAALFAVMVMVMVLLGKLHVWAGVAFGSLLFLGAITFPFWFIRNTSPGTDDNASGVFAVLESLRRIGHLAGLFVVPVFFNYEELGLLGSRVWVGRHLRKKGLDLSGLIVDKKTVYVINFDTVGRGRHIFVSGTRSLREKLLKTKAARTLGARRTWLYPSDHLSFRPGLPAVSLLRADRFWLLDLRWVHSKRDSHDWVDLARIVEVADLVEEFARQIANQRSQEGT